MLSISLLVAVPAGILRAGCIGDTCKDRSATGVSGAPFCSLPAEVRSDVAAGYRKGRSPEILGVAGAPGLSGPVEPGWRSEEGAVEVAWPTPEGSIPVAVAIGGAGVTQGAIPEAATLADVAPTVAEVIGLERPHPEVRSGSAWPGLASGERPSFVLEVVWKGSEAGGGEILKTTPFEEISANGIEGLIRPGSVPLDPAPLMATLGSGAVPAEHGITGTYIRSDEGLLVEAWTQRAPGSVVAMLADDLDELTVTAGAALIGDAPADLGLVGSDWYLSGDKDEVSLSQGATPREQAQRVKALFQLKRLGFRQGDVTDLVAVTLRGDTAEMARATERIIGAAEKTAPGDVLYVLVALPISKPAGDSESTVSSSDVAAQIESSVGAPVIEAVAGGGFFLDQEVLADENVSEDAILAAMDEMRAPSGGELFADRFSGVAVTFARYC